MVSKSLSTLIDEAILPALLLILAKFAGVLIVTWVIGSSWQLKFSSALPFLPSVSYPNYETYLASNSYSNFFMYLVLVMGCSVILVRAHFFHSSHISPTLHARLASLRLSSLVSDTFSLYHQGTIWLLFLWLATILILIQSFLSLNFAWIAIISFLVTLNFSWFLLVDIEQEIEIWRREHQRKV
jgi:hypothetical protein